MKTLVFDTSSLISIAVNSLFWTLPQLKERFPVEFVIPPSVQYELVEKPLKTRKYKLEAIMIQTAIAKKELIVAAAINVEDLLATVNNIYHARNQNIVIVQHAEVEALALALKARAQAYVVDERTMRLVIEDPKHLHAILEKKLHTRVAINKQNLRAFQETVKGVKIIRSTELMMVALEHGILDAYLPGSTRKELADAILWGLRLRGCAISTEEIQDLVQLEK